MISDQKYFEARNLIIEFDYVNSYLTIFQKPGSEYKNKTDLSIDNHLESSFNKTVNFNPSSTRNMSLISPSSSIHTYKPSSGSEYSDKIKMIYSDGLENVNSSSKLPFVKLAVDLTSSIVQIKQIFVKEAGNL